MVIGCKLYVIYIIGRCESFFYPTDVNNLFLIK